MIDSVGRTILVKDSDHSYRVAYTRVGLAAYNTVTKRYSEYVGDDYLDNHEVAVEVVIVE